MMTQQQNKVPKYRNIFFCQKYGKFLLAGDVALEETEPNLSEFLSNYDAKNLVKSKPCIKNPLNPQCIDLSITNNICSFQIITTLVCGLSDFHKFEKGTF